MLYDLYKGTIKDFENSEGELIKGRVSKAWLRGFFLAREIKTADVKKAIDGDLIPYKDGILWIEEAM